MRVFELTEELFRDSELAAKLLFAFYFIPAVAIVTLVEWIFNGFVTRPVIVRKGKTSLGK